MTLREEYFKLENKIIAEYDRLINIGDYDVLTQTVKECYDIKAENVLEMIENEGTDEAVRNWDLLECLEELFYYDRRGEERLCYLLGAEKENGLYVFDDERQDTMFLPLNALSSNYSKLTVVETLQNNLNQ